MAAKKAKSGKKVPSKPKAAAKKTAKKVAKKAEGLLGKLAQRSAQLIIDSGLLGEAPKKKSSKRAPAKKQARKA